MATINQAHYGPGGMLLYHGELILLFCDAVTVSLSSPNYKETGRLYLTTHRMVFTSKNLESQFKSLSAPFMSMVKVDLEQPIFGANYISVQARHADTTSPHLNFKLKFMHGGAIEYGQAMHNAVQMTARNSNYFQQAPMAPPPAYTPSAAQYYQAPPNVYQPAYNCGFPLPNQMFDQAPPVGFVYMSDAPPPYPGLGANNPPPQGGGVPPQNGGGPPEPGFNSAPQNAPYPTQNPYPNLNGSAAAPGQPGFQAPSYPGQAPSYPGQAPSYPGQGPPAPGYPGFNDGGQTHPSAPPMGKN